ncbi:MAG: GTP cyclohydrolase II [Rhodobacteraceae bacterium]|nr:GTP cyclohydrolase II [Paracoccaceae bacterium]
MVISITPADRRARARADLRLGLPIAALAEGGALILAATELLTPARLSELRRLGPVQVALTKWRAVTLSVPAHDRDLVRIRAPGDAPVRWFHAMADPAFAPVRGPFDFVRAGSAAVPRAVLRLCKEAGLLPAVVSVRADPVPAGLLCLTADDLRPPAGGGPGRVASARVPLAVSRQGRVHVYRPADGGADHYAIEVGFPARNLPVLSRLHSACFTGDLLGSLKCDCGAQLQGALRQIGAEGAGVLIYLNQEGRGLGLANKMRAYALQDQGFDTAEANHRLGFEDDERDFRLGADILRDLGFSAVRLMTNNPAKVARLAEAGVRVAERVSLRAGETPDNVAYLKTKAEKFGHDL